METAHLPKGTLLQGGKYKIVRFIGSGGFGCTYEGEHTMLGSKVAIKEFFVRDFCNREETTSHVTVGTTEKKGLVEKLLKKFVEEARFTAGMRHPNIARVSDVFEENGTAYYVMDYIDGPSLDRMVKTSGPMDEANALRYIRQVADALAYVHKQNRLHLDVKPGNIMTDEEDNAILIDFGASKQYDEVGGENTSTLMGKTPGYAPIEQMGNTVITFTPATDIYALGATLYKLLTGTTPLEATMLASGEELAPLPSNISASTANAVSSAMQLAKSRRPQTIAEFIALLSFKDEESKSFTPPTPPTPLTDTNTGEETTFDGEHGKPEPEQQKKEIGQQPELKQEKELNPDFQSKSNQPQKKKSRKGGKVVAIIFGVLALAFGIIVLIDTSWPSIYGTPASGQVNGYDYVDLGLSVNWATCNVGSSSPSGYGGYFAWGETATKSEYSEKTSATYGKNFKDIMGNAKYDAACANWGGNWRMPTEKEMQELIDKCTWKKRKIYGTKGFLVTGPNGRSIFLPSAGSRGRWYDYGYGYYWCSTPKENTSYNSPAANLFFAKRFLSKSLRWINWSSRTYGYSVRPVIDLTVSGYVNSHGYVDLGLSVKWASCNIGASYPSDYGDYYAWGESQTKSEYTKENNKTYEKKIDTGNLSYDIAYANWGDKWRLPSKSEIDELENKCKFQWTSLNGHYGYKVVGANGNSIFLPASGWRETDLNQLGARGYYWSSTTIDPYGYGFAIDKDSLELRLYARYYGFSARPVLGQSLSTTANSTSSSTSSSGSATTQQGANKTSTQTTSSSSSTTASTTSKTGISASGYINGHQYVDLGLSVKWATCNIGASLPSDYGNYYAWGETQTKSEYMRTNSVTLKKYIGSIAGSVEYDVARVIWGGTWRLPTENEIDELVSKCKLTWTTQGGHKGYMVTGPNGNSLFLPAAGGCYGTSLEYAEERGRYWCATPYGADQLAYNLSFDDCHFCKDWNFRSYGFYVRPVN